MSDKARAKKLAAAKRKLKEYHELKGKQQIPADAFENENYKSSTKIEAMLENERCEENEKGFNLQGSSEKVNNSAELEDFKKMQTKNVGALKELNGSENSIHIEAIEILIGEKASLLAQVTKLQTSCKEKDLEIEELNTMLDSARKRIENLEKTTIDQNSDTHNLRSNVEELRSKISSQESEKQKYKSQCEEQVDHIEELKHELALRKSKNDEIEAELKEKTCQVELYKIRINQISEEANVATDTRVEDLTQAKFTHEQQIHDLEAMVKQLNSEKEQSSQQYQNYVQHLNKEISVLSEKNLELMNDRSKLIDREKGMIDHIARLEKQIQDNMARQEIIKNNENEQANSELLKENLSLKQQIKDLQQQCEDLNSSLRLQNEKLAELSSQIDDKQLKIEEFEKRYENLQSEKPDNAKLLAAIESDKVAASRAVAQNEELKKQLEEIQIKLIQVTNEKVELVEHLHSEQHANREIRANYEHMIENLKNTTEKLHFKDEEMIRLTHENNELNKIVLQLNQQVDRLMHYEAKDYVHTYVDGGVHQHKESDHSDTEECNHNNEIDGVRTESACEALQTEELSSSPLENLNIIKRDKKISTDLPATEAILKLQNRFKTLIGEVADLTDEKQRLEHLVLQLQGETETIGEYITLYQNQRRVLKQREIEKDTQLHRLLVEREEMREKTIELTQLINNLEVKSENVKKEVIHEKIHSLISDIKEKDNIELKPIGSVDHCACCSGKFETI